MSDVLIRDLPEDVVTALDAAAARVGLSRNEYLRRRLTADAHTTTAIVTGADLRSLTETINDLGDDALMAQAWR